MRPYRVFNMKMARQTSSLVAVLSAVLGSVLASQVTAQTFTALHAFTGDSDGAWPYGRLVLSGNTLYGTTYAQRSTNAMWVQGAVFAVETDGTGFTSLHVLNGSDGLGPRSGLVLSGNTLYGTACMGGGDGFGTAFAIHTDATGFAPLHSFVGEELDPHAGLTLAGNTLFGTASDGGALSSGSVFRLNTDGTGFTNLHNFADVDGSGPQAALVLSEHTLYGTTGYGGLRPGNGTVFRLNTDGTGFTNLHSFAGYPNDGANPFGGLVLLGNTLYGTTDSGGSSGDGTVFAVNTDGTGFAILHNFAGHDGALPSADLILVGNTLYGTTSRGGSSGRGTVFALKTDGTGFTNLYNFTALSGPYPGTNSDGTEPSAGLILAGSTLYGVALYGGTFGNGTVFSISFVPKLEITPAGANVCLRWPTNQVGFDYTGYRLQCTTNLISPVWTTNFPEPWIVDGQYTITNPISELQQFFRLSN